MEIRVIPGQPLRNLDDTYTKEKVLKELEWVHKRINEVFLKGKLELQRVLTPAGTTGAQRIDENAGTVNFPAAAASLVVTNSRVNGNSLVFCVLMTSDATARLKCVVPDDGFFTISLTAAATIETRCGFLVFN